MHYVIFVLYGVPILLIPSWRAALLGGGPGEGLPSTGKSIGLKKSPSVSNVLLSFDQAHTLLLQKVPPLHQLESHPPAQFRPLPAALLRPHAFGDEPPELHHKHTAVRPV